jgi:hypothetical protein
VCAPFVGLHKSRRHSTLCQTFCNKGWSSFGIAVGIRLLKLSTVIGTGGTETSCFTKLHRKKSRKSISGDSGSQEVEDRPRNVHHPVPPISGPGSPRRSPLRICDRYRLDVCRATNGAHSVLVKGKKALSVAVYSGVRLIFVWQLLSYQ